MKFLRHTRLRHKEEIMKYAVGFFNAVLLCLLLISCGSVQSISESTQASIITENTIYGYTGEDDGKMLKANETQAMSSADAESIKIRISVNGKEFLADLYQTKTAEELKNRLPITLEMNELNGNEKYSYLPESLTTDSYRPDKINSGDIMLYGSDCLVLFYECFDTSYSYTKIGRIEDTDGLVEAVGNGKCSVELSCVSEKSDESSSDSFILSDLIKFNKYMMGIESGDNLTEKYDLNEDKSLNILDLLLLKSILLSEKSQTNILVAYFSATNTTRPIAEQIAEITDADLFEIVPVDEYSSDDIKYTDPDCRANKEQNDSSVRPAIVGSIDNFDQYDTVFIGHPIWWSEEPRIIDTFIESYDFSGKTVIDFCTSGSSGISLSESNLKSLSSPDAIWLKGKRFQSNVSYTDIEKWISDLGIYSIK